MTPSLDSLAEHIAASIGRDGEGLDFETTALQLFERQFEANAVYRRLCLAAHRTPDSVAHWSGIPPVPTVAFQEFELTALDPARRTRVFHSSGTTARRPSRHFHHSASLALYEASAKAWFVPHLLRDRESLSPGTRLRWVSLTPPPEAVPNSSLVHMIASLGERLASPPPVFAGRVAADGTWEVHGATLLPLLEEASAGSEPVFLLGTAFSYVHLLDDGAVRDRRFRLPPGSRLLETGGYKGRSREVAREDLYGALAQRLDVPLSWIVSEYGMSELSSQAYDHVAGHGSGTAESPAHAASAPFASRRFQFPPWARVAVVSPETGREVGEGEIGLLKIWDLANVWSVLAIQTGDLARRCGDGFSLAGRIPRAEPRGCSLMAP